MRPRTKGVDRPAAKRAQAKLLIPRMVFISGMVAKVAVSEASGGSEKINGERPNGLVARTRTGSGPAFRFQGNLANAAGLGSIGGLCSGSLISASTWRWLFQHAGFPAHRLAAKAELLLLFAAASEADALEAGGDAPKIRQDAALLASQRQLAQNRKHAHFKSDNRTKI